MGSEDEVKGWGRKRRLILQIVVAVAIIAILIIIFLASTPADPYDTVDKIMSDPSKYEGEYVEVRGKVEGWYPSNMTFSLAGYLEDDPKAIHIVYAVVPESFANGKDVVVKGVFDHNGLIYEIGAEEIVVGCSSRY